MTMWCWCPEIVYDDRGQPAPCRAIAWVIGVEPMDSTSGPRTVLLAHTRCYAGHPCTPLFDDLELLA